MSQNLRGELTPDVKETAMPPRALLLVDLQNDFVLVARSPCRKVTVRWMSLTAD